MSALESASPAEVGMSAERLELARTMVRDHVASGGTPSAVAIVLRQGKVVLAEAQGVQRPGGPALSFDHVWPITSAGKPVAAAMVMSLVETGHIGVMQPIVDYIPEMAGNGNDEVLVHHLLTHTAGWSAPMFTGRMTEVMRSGELPEPPEGRDPITHLFLWLGMHPERVAPVGQEMCYANISYALLGEIVRRVTGGTFDAALRERVLDPLGMRRSALIVDDALRPHLVAREPHLPFGSSATPGHIAFQGEVWETCDEASVGVHASPRDVASFGQMILDGGIHIGDRILASTSVRAMCTNQIPGVRARFADRFIREASWGYGFSVINEQRWPFFGGGLVPLGSVSHPGAGGVSYWIDFEHEIVGVFFEVITRISPVLEPVSGIGHRFQDVIVGAVVE